MAALRDRSTGTISWKYWDGFGQYTTYATVNMVGDGTAREFYTDLQDLSGWYARIHLRELRPAAFFAECLDNEDVFARYDCVREALGDTVFVCDPGFENDGR